MAGGTAGHRFWALLLVCALCLPGTYAWYRVTKFPPPRPPPRRPPPPASYPSLDALLSSSPDYSCARTLFTAAPGPLVASRYPSATFFVPDNKAFSLYLTVLGLDNCTALAALGPAAVAALVSYHMIPNAAPTSGSLALGETPVPSGLEGYGLTIIKESSSVVYVESAESKALATRRDVRLGTASIAHVVDRVLVPYDLLAPPPGVQTWGTLAELLVIRNLTTSLTALQQIPVFAQLLKATDINATVFVPLDSAWFSLAFSGALSPRVLQVLQQQDATALEVATLLFGDHMHFGDSLNDTQLAARSSLPVGFGDYADPSAPVLRVAAAPAGGRLNVRLTGRTSALVTEPNYRVGAMTVHLVDNVLVTEATYARIEVIVTPRYPTMADAIKSQPDLSRFWAAVESASAAGGASLLALMNDTAAPLTVFAPTDAALEAFMQAASLSPRAQAIPPNQLMLLIVRAHISIRSTTFAADLADGQLVDVALNEGSAPVPSRSPRVKLVSGQAPQLVTLTRAAVSRADTLGGGGVLHVLDGVLLPLRAAVLVGLFGDQPANVTVEPGSLLAAMDNTPSTSVLASMVRGLGLAPTLASATLAATLFAPSDFGFPDALVGLVDEGPANGTLPGMVDLPDALRQLLSDHLHVGTRLLSTQLTDGQVLPMGPDPALYGPATSVTVSATNSTVVLRSLLTAAVTQPDVLAGGMAVMHVVEGMVLLQAAAQALGLDIEPVPLPPPPPAAEPEPAPSPADGPPPMYPNAIEALRADPTLSNFLGIAQQNADLSAALSSPDTVATYFVPTDAALQGLLGGLAGRRRSLLQDDGDIELPTYIEVIGLIVSSHLSFGRAILSTDIVNGTLVAVGEPSEDGPAPWNSPLLLVNDTGVFLMTVTAAKVIRPDITAGKAVIHVVDNLAVTLEAALLLSSVSAVPVPVSPQPGSFLEAMQASADLSIVTAIAKQVGFGDTLSSATLSATLFVPDDASMQAAFQLIAEASSLSNSGVGVPYITGAVRELIGSHIHVGDRYTSNDLTAEQVIPMGPDPARYSEGARVSVQVLTANGVVSLASMQQSVVTRPDAVNSTFGAMHVVQGAILTPAVAEAFGICNPCYASLLPALSDLNANSLLLLYNAAVDLPVVGDQLRESLQPPFTIFAPTDDAFSAYVAARNTTLEAIAATPLAIAQLILPHLALGQQLPLSALTDGTFVSTGDPRFFTAQLEVDVDGTTGAVRVFRRDNPAAAATILGSLTVGLPVTVGQPDIIVHVVDRVIE